MDIKTEKIHARSDQSGVVTSDPRDGQGAKFDHQSMDAAVWAREFVRLNSASDEGTMIAWFANAIMAGFDEANRRRDAAAKSGGNVMSDPIDEVKDDQILASLLAHKLKLSMRVIASAQTLAWRDLPMNEKRAYMAHAEQALKAERSAS